MDKDKMIYDLLKEVREDQKKHGHELQEQSKCLSKVQSDLKYHIKRTDMLEDLHKDNQQKIEINKDRISKLEEPGRFKQYLAKKWKFWTIAIVMVSASITLISKLKGLQ